jgi:hypothetical protein
MHFLAVMVVLVFIVNVYNVCPVAEYVNVYQMVVVLMLQFVETDVLHVAIIVMDNVLKFFLVATVAIFVGFGM